MTGLSFKSVVLSLAIVCFLGGSAVADSFTFTGNATFGNDVVDFFPSGPSFSIGSAAPGGSNLVMGMCTVGALCTIPAQFIPTMPSLLLNPGDFSQGTVGRVTAESLEGGLTFSGFSFTAITNSGSQFFGSGPVTFTGDLTGNVFVPLGCEPQPGSCTDVGPQVFHLQLSGSGTGTASGTELPDGTELIREVDYTFSGLPQQRPSLRACCSAAVSQGSPR